LGRAVPTSGPRTAYICNGDFATLLFNRSFYATGGTSKSVASLWTSRAIMDHARAVETYDLLLANSRFTQNFMSHLYGVPFSGICHPPVDLVRFQPSASPPTNSYALALGRGPREQGIDVLTEVARIGRLKVVGGAEIRGAESAGVVSDDRLAQLYAEAAFVVFPVVSEFFGYAVAESLACGTPVLCYGLCGPGELVTNGVDGWTVNSRSEFLRVAAEVMARGYPASYRAAARGAASRFSATEVARSLIKSLRQASGETPREA
jgi:glycosyltransferase involved in cell wall biosynthesis